VPLCSLSFLPLTFLLSSPPLLLFFSSSLLLFSLSRESLADHIYWQFHMIVQAAMPGSKICVIPSRHVVVDGLWASRFEATFEKARVEIPEATDHLKFIEQVVGQYDNDRRFTTAKKYIMQEVRAAMPGAGGNKLTHVASLCNLMVLFTVSPPPRNCSDEDYEVYTTSAATMTPMPTSWNEVPIHFLARTQQEVREKLGKLKSCYILNDHGHRCVTLTQT